ncbi:MAG: dihydrodipicolinate synthase family protein [Kiritimatiellia bacterium]
MNKQKLLRPLCGIVPPMITPLKDRDTLDLEGLEKLVEHILAGGVQGLFIMGTTGEGPSLSYRLRRELVAETCRLVRSRTPVLVGISDTAFEESLGVARFSADAGSDALVVAPPYYMPEGQPELREYLAHLLAELPLPLYLYNMPPLTKVSFELETVRWAMDQEKILGLKDSSGSMIYFNQVRTLLRHRPDWTLLIGPEELLAESVLLGGHGGVSGGANVFPGLFVELYRAAREGDLKRTRALQVLALQVGEKLYHIGRHSSAIIKGIKCALECLGVCDDFMAEPFHKFRASERRMIEKAMEELVPLIKRKT